MADYVSGVAELIAKLDKLAEAAAIEKAISDSCLLVEAEARKKAPKGDGTLRQSITSETKSTEEEIIGEVFTPLLYAPYVEYGTGLFAEDGKGRQNVPWSYKDDKGEWHTTCGQHPNPFLRPALTKNKNKIKKLIGEALKND